MYQKLVYAMYVGKNESREKFKGKIMDAPKLTTAKRGKKSKRTDKRPSRAKYWMKRTLEQKKIHNLMKHCGMTKAQATKVWHKGLHLKTKGGKLRYNADGTPMMWGMRKGRVPVNHLRVA